jgi:hypothetical protein
MKKIQYILFIFLLLSCSSIKNIEKESNNQNTWNIINIKTDEENLEEIKKLLGNEQAPITKSTSTWIINTTESWILSEKELKIIENTNSWEIDNLIDILFQDLN